MEQSYRPAEDVKDAIIVWSSTTTSAGAIGGTTIVDTALTQGNTYWDNMGVLILSGNSNGQIRTISSYSTGTITVSPAFASQIASGTKYNIIAAVQPTVGGGSATLANQTTILSNTSTTGIGRAQIATTTISLNQAAETYTLFTGTTQAVMIEKLIIQMPNEPAGGALTSISIQTNDATPQTFITSQQGAVANLTAEAQLSNTSPIKISTGKRIQLTIAGGAHGSAYVCNVTVLYRAIVAGGTLA